jgi:hypothetical protein
VAVEGKVEHKFDMKPTNMGNNDEAYRKLCRDRLNKSMLKTRTTQVLDELLMQKLFVGYFESTHPCNWSCVSPAYLSPGFLFDLDFIALFHLWNVDLGLEQVLQNDRGGYMRPMPMDAWPVSASKV